MGSTRVWWRSCFCLATTGTLLVLVRCLLMQGAGGADDRQRWYGTIVIDGSSIYSVCASEMVEVSELVRRRCVRCTPEWAEVYTRASSARAWRKWACGVCRYRPARAGTPPTDASDQLSSRVLVATICCSQNIDRTSPKHRSGLAAHIQTRSRLGIMAAVQKPWV